MTTLESTMLSDDEREAMRELERQFSVGPFVVDEPYGGRQRSRLANILALVTSTICTVALLAAGSVGVALQPGTAAGPEMQALTRLHQLFVRAGSRRLIPDRIAPAPEGATTMRQTTLRRRLTTEQGPVSGGPHVP